MGVVACDLSCGEEVHGTDDAPRSSRTVGVMKVEMAVVTVYGEVSSVLARVKELESVEFWYADILHGAVPLSWLHAWVTALAPSSPGRFGGVVLSTGHDGQVLLSIPPEIIDHPVPPDSLCRLLGLAS